MERKRKATSKGGKGQIKAKVTPTRKTCKNKDIGGMIVRLTNLKKVFDVYSSGRNKCTGRGRRLMIRCERRMVDLKKALYDLDIEMADKENEYYFENIQV